jgi:hypothetical protein
MAQQTAVEWLVDKVEDFIGLIPIDIIEQAKEMEKQEKAKCWIASAKYGLKILNTGEKADFKAAFEQYYTETYGTQLQNETN